MNTLAVLVTLALASVVSASIHDYGLHAIAHPYAHSPVGPSGIVTGYGAHGPSGTVTGAGAAGPSGIVTGHGAVGPTGPNGHGHHGIIAGVVAAPAITPVGHLGVAGVGHIGLGHVGLGHTAWDHGHHGLSHGVHGW